MTIRNQIEIELKKVLDSLGVAGGAVRVDYPADPKHGDYATNIALATFVEIKNQKSLQFGGQAKIKDFNSPLDLAEEIAQQLRTKPFDSAQGKNSDFRIFERVEVVRPGFINFFLEDTFLIQKLQESTTGTSGSEMREKKGTVVVEYSSPNIAKPFTIGHLRSTIIGDAVANLLETVGFKVYRDSHVGDWGTQFGKLIYAVRTWGNEAEIASSARPVKMLVDLYVRFHEEAERDPKLEDEARGWFKKLEDGDKQARELWQKCIEWSWIEFDVIYKKLGVPSGGEFVNDGRGYGESYFEDRMQSVIKELEEKGLLKTGKEGAKVVEFDPSAGSGQVNLPPLMILKKDGATLYATRDLATDKFRLEKYGKDVRIINEVGAEQELYFRQLYKLEEMLGWFNPSQRVNLKHGLIRFREGKMSTRKGNTIWLEDVLNEAVSRAGKLAESGEEGGVETTKAVAVGAIKWNDLKRSTLQDISFDWDEILNMQGNSGPYVQYAYARTQSVLDKSEIRKTKSETNTKYQIQNTKYNLQPEERELLRLLARFDEVIVDAAGKLAPNTLCNFLFELAQMFNLFYQKHQILKADTSDSRDLRLFLTQKTGEVLRKGLQLLGIEAPAKM